MPSKNITVNEDIKAKHNQLISAYPSLDEVIHDEANKRTEKLNSYLGGHSPWKKDQEAFDTAVNRPEEEVGTAEFNFPLGLPEEYDVRGRVFTDFGTACGYDGSDAGIEESKSLAEFASGAAA